MVVVLEELSATLWCCWRRFLVFLGLFLQLISLFLCLLFFIEKLFSPEVVDLEGFLAGRKVSYGLLAAIVQM